jgi:hypothetical protein
MTLVFRSLRERATPVAIILTLAAGVAAQAATVTRQVYINFDGTLTGGNTYALGPGELDVTGTFRKNGGASIAGGVADVPGNLNAASGFVFSSATLPALTTTNWISEALVLPDVPAAAQPGTFNHLLDVRGDLFYRYNGNTAAPKFMHYGFYDGSTETSDTTPELSTTQYSHVALAWNASTRTLQGFVDGVSQGTLSTGNVFATPSVNVGYGFFARTGFMNRAIDGKLDAVAFSTYTGTLNPGFGTGFDFQLDPADAPSLALELVVNTISGKMTIVNNTSSAISINGYEVTSAEGSLDVSASGWRSLDDQGIDPVFGGDGPGETWQEGGNPSSSGFLEAFLLGSSSLAPGESFYLGRAYDELMGGDDLEFSYRLASQAGVRIGSVVYDDTLPLPLYGDFNNDGIVDAVDYTVWRNNLGGSVELPNDPTPDDVTIEDYGVWKSNYGTSEATGSGGLASEAHSVPEPTAAASAVAVVLAGLVGSLRIRTASVARLAAITMCVLAWLPAMAVAQAPPAPHGVTPAPRQLAWHEQEYYAFIHFGHNTFTNEEWGWSQSTPDVFNPTQLDTDQWAQAFVDAGMTGMILTAKHHDGMALWDTATTEYKIANGTWAQNRVTNGLDANVVRMAAESAKAKGLKFGVYLSPWDMHRDPAVAKAHLDGTIYDEPQIFGDASPGDYNDLYATQLTELVTMQLSDGSPIEISEVWLDGASGSSTVQTFDWTLFRDIIRTHQPDAIMWGHQGVDARWVGQRGRRHGRDQLAHDQPHAGRSAVH